MWLKILFFSPFEHIGHLEGYFKLWQEDVIEIAKSGRLFKLINRLMSERKVPLMSPDFKNIMQETWIALVSAMVGFLKNLHDVLDKPVYLLQHFILHISHGPSSAWDALVAASCQRFREDYPKADEELMEWREQRRPADWDMHYPAFFPTNAATPPTANTETKRKRVLEDIGFHTKAGFKKPMRDNDLDMEENECTMANYDPPLIQPD
ncbi:hypothetical protein HDK77DRAFT_487870 [Phyllosticta capitalensis]